jgi:energy-converting hydrogenase Eha subunit A
MFALILAITALFTAAAAENQTIDLYDADELTAAARAVIASIIAMAVYTLNVLQKPRALRPAWDVAAAQALLTGVFAVISVLIIRQVNNNLTAEWLTAAVIGSEGPSAVKWLKSRFAALWKGGEGK